MSEEQLKAFLEKVKGDTSLQGKLNGAADADAVVEIAKEAGFSITAEDIQSMNRQSTAELSDEELEGAAGGFSMNCPRGPGGCSWSAGRGCTRRPGGGVA
jgi:predicted ribosomally synthesized peptide with nif11-like leader